eukprot:TRINITY_DN24491_c0_g1_i1.p1 TRINITY_DN24491_c0_g1~~TRINITY_DN24491_c0_g1_i1.p1  ORF type:complete len:148 (-),score=2.34 TRINITY_DN24491_c0_g1_i1:17-460(-)
MGLRMPAPWRHPRTGVYYLRVRVPADLPSAIGQRISLPVGEGWRGVRIGEAVKVSLDTREPAEAKRRHHEAMAHLERLFAAARQGPVSLPHKDIVALAGEAHVDAVAAMEGDPVLSAAGWHDLAEQFQAAQEGREGPYRNLGSGPIK